MLLPALKDERTHVEFTREEFERTRYVGPLLTDREGRLKPVPAALYRDEITRDERLKFCTVNGVYSLPTTELIEWLRERVAGRRAMEIGSGTGVISRALRIRGTDSFMQKKPEFNSFYRMNGQTPVQYSHQVEKFDANTAVVRFKPQVVIAAWVTHKYREDRAWAEGNAWGVDEEHIIQNCDTYIFIGNRHTHRNKSIWDLPHEIIEPDWLFSRHMTDAKDFIAVWERAKLTGNA